MVFCIIFAMLNLCKRLLYEVFFVGGEASGDIHAAELIKELRKVDSEAEFVYLGGDLMREAAGSEPVVDYRDMAYMGFHR